MSDLPQPNEGFGWVQAAGGPALACRAFEPHARHFFTTRQHGLAASDSAAWAAVADALGVERSRLVTVKQVHGSAVCVLRSASAPSGAVEADIIIAGGEASPFGLAVRAADCVPLLIVDRRHGAVAAAHAGWRGLAARAPAVTVEALGREFGSRPSDLIAAIGPSIGACCYEVGADVRTRFASAFGRPGSARWFHDDPVRSPVNPPMPGLPEIRRDDHWFFDGWAAARDQLLAAGLPANQVYTAGLCTASHPVILSSYRRDGVRAGRLAGVIRTSSFQD
jgi:YfiH family protein